MRRLLRLCPLFAVVAAGSLAAGLEILARAGTAKPILGRIRPEEVRRLAAVDVVRYLAPAR